MSSRTQNVAPKITGQSPLSVNEGASITIELSHLQVTDPDNNYPNGFTLKLFPGKDYTLNGNTVTPSPNFSGNLKVPVTVNDGQNESNRFESKNRCHQEPECCAKNYGPITIECE